MNKAEVLRIVFALKRLDKQLGQLAEQPALQRAPTYTRLHLTEIRDELMKEVNNLWKETMT